MNTTTIKVNIPTDELENIKNMAKERSISVTEAIRSSLITELYLYKARSRGALIILQETNGLLKQVSF